VQPNEWEEQLSTVLDRHLPKWKAAAKSETGEKTENLEKGSHSVEQVARASIAVNSALSAASRGEPAERAKVLLELFALGPAGWRRYLRDSRILQRVGSRLKLQRTRSKVKSRRP